jgi:glyoxylase-like metal-dependent hydrolase (beta-lactamase superfamily II)
MNYHRASRTSLGLLELFCMAMMLLVLACSAVAADSGKVTSSRVADGVYLFTTSRYGDVGFGGNAIAILTEEGVVMFDTSGTPASAQAILTELRQLSNKPVLYVINSHWHWDHWGGNQAFKTAYPNVQFLSSEKNLNLMMHTAVTWNAPGLERDLPNYISQQKQDLATAEAKHVPDAQLTEMRELLAADEDFLQQKRSVVYTFPNLVFSDSVTLFLGGREIRVLHTRAITPGDTYVYLPKEKILITGDILVSPIPFAVGGSYPQDWIATLRTLDALEVQMIVPGHGAVEHDKTYLRQNLTLFQHLVSDVRKARIEGRSLQEAQAEFGSNAAVYAADIGLPQQLLPAFKGYFLEVFVNRVYHELQGPLGDSPTS